MAAINKLTAYGIISATTATIGWAILNIGYYNTYWAEDNKTVVFIKKEPTLTIQFENMFASDKDFKNVQDLSDADRQDLIDYCRYHLGFITQIKTESDRDGCHKAYIDSFKKSQ